MVVASFGDVPLVGDRAFVMVEHGTGCSYGGEPPDGSTPDLAHRCNMLALACPNEIHARRTGLHHPPAMAEVTGCAKLDAWPPDRVRGVTDPPTVALLWHWPNRWIAPESNWAFPHWRDAVAVLAARGVDRLGYRLVGHGHPRSAAVLWQFYRRSGIPVVAGLGDVWEQASVVTFDNTSAGFESMAVGIPAVVLDCPEYRRDVEHGIRFWWHADAGVRVGGGDADELHDAIVATLRDDPAAKARAAAVAELYPCQGGGAAARVADLAVRAARRASP